MAIQLLFDGGYVKTSGSYQANFVTEEGCDSMVTLVLGVDEFTRDTTIASICPGERYLFHGTNYEAAGIYRDTLSYDDRCDEIVVLELSIDGFVRLDSTIALCEGHPLMINGSTVLESGVYLDTLLGSSSCDTIIAFDVEVKPGVVQRVEQILCEGTMPTFTNQRIEGSGLYRDTFPAANGCDSIMVWEVTVLPQAETMFMDTICKGEVYVFNGERITSAGIFCDTLTAANGCDSVSCVDLVLLRNGFSTIEATICEGEPYVFEDTTVMNNGIYERVVPKRGGCDSTITLILSVLPKAFDTIRVDLCAGESYPYDGTVLREAGDFPFNYQASNGCDSIVTVRISITDYERFSDQATICGHEAFMFGGEPISSSGQYMDTVRVEQGCDTIYTLDLTVLESSRDTIAQTICEGEAYQIGNRSLDEAGLHEVGFANRFGCDSIMVVDLSVIRLDTGYVQQVVCAGESYTIGDQTFDESGIYGVPISRDGQCDSLVLLDLEVKPELSSEINSSICNAFFVYGRDTLRISGRFTYGFTSVDGCDSTVVVSLSNDAVITNQITEELCLGESITFGNQMIDRAGIYRDTTVSQSGCDSITVLSVMALFPQITTLSDTICKGDAVVFDGDRITRPGIYEKVYAAANGCDSVVQLSVALKRRVYLNEQVAVCEGEPYVFEGQPYEAPGIYEVVLDGPALCDTIMVLQLSATPGVRDTIRQTICQGSEYTFDGQSLSTSGFYTRTVFGAEGCSGFEVLALSVVDQIETTVDRTICQGDQITIGNQTFNAAGTYEVMTTSVFGCDSLITLNLAVVDAFETMLEAVHCGDAAYDFLGTSLDQSGRYQDTLSSRGGCDSIIILDLTIFPEYSSVLDTQVCLDDILIVGNQVITTDGAYTERLMSTNGCDSIITMQVSFVDTFRDTTVVEICAGSTYTFDGRSLSQPGLYEQTIPGTTTLCHTIHYLDLRWADTIIETTIYDTLCVGETIVFGGDEISSSGTYTELLQTTTGCDSLVILELTLLEGGLAEIMGPMVTCVEDVQLEGNLLPGTTGLWQTTSAAIIESVDQAQTMIRELAPGANVFTWQLSDANCGVIATDTFTVTYLTDPPIANDDAFALGADSTELLGNVALNDEVANFNNQWAVDLVSQPTFGTVQIEVDGTFRYLPDVGATGMDQFSYQLTSTDCSELLDTAIVSIDLAGTPDPNRFGITPDGNGVNEYFILPILRDNPLEYENNELMIFNRWGDEVFQAKSYQNDWGGQGPDGRILPAGTYYYVLKLDVLKGLVQKGVVVIVR